MDSSHARSATRASCSLCSGDHVERALCALSRLVRPLHVCWRLRIDCVGEWPDVMGTAPVLFQSRPERPPSCPVRLSRLAHPSASLALLSSVRLALTDGFRGLSADATRSVAAPPRQSVRHLHGRRHAPLVRPAARDARLVRTASAPASRLHPRSPARHRQVLPRGQRVRSCVRWIR